MSRPQPLGLLPTWWFWRDLRDERPLVGSLVGALVGTFGAAVSWCMITAGVYLPVALVAAMLAPMLGLGLIERGFRRLILRRRQALAKGAPPPNIVGSPNRICQLPLRRPLPPSLQVDLEAKPELGRE